MHISQTKNANADDALSKLASNKDFDLLKMALIGVTIR